LCTCIYSLHFVRYEPTYLKKFELFISVQVGNIILCPMYEIINVVLFHNVTCYNNSLLSCIHVSIAKFLNITCTLVAKRNDIREVRMYVKVGLNSYCLKNRTWDMTAIEFAS